MNTKQLKSGRPSDRMATSGKSQAARGTSGAGIRLGDYNRLTMVKEARRADSHAFREEETFGIYLDGGDEGEILMPKRYVPDGVKHGDSIDCFVYLDQDERLIATTEKPLARVGDFAYLKCSWVNEYGAFLDWGLMKDLFCPFREQKRRMEIGESYIVHVHIDEDSYRIVASAKVDRYMEPALESPRDAGGYKPGDEVNLLVWQKTDLGFKVIVDNRHAGLVYANQLFRSIHTGDRMKGYVANVRPDGKLDISLRLMGRMETLDFAGRLLQYLKNHDGKCALGDKSDADEIRRAFQVSKKTYKKAVGDLYKKRLIRITDGGIELV